MPAVRFSRLAALFLSLMMLMLVSCSSDSSTTPVGKLATQKVGPEGGSVTTDAGVRIDIPPGALTTEVEITINGLGKIDPPEGATAIHGGYQFEPEGLTFLVPAKVTLPIAGPYPQGSHVAVARQTAGAAWTLLEGEATDTSVTVETPGFSQWLAVLLGGNVGKAGKRSDDEVTWTRQFGTDSADEVTALAVGPDDAAVVVGLTYGGFSGAKPGGNGDAFVRKYDTAGNEVWTRQFGFGSTEHAKAVAIDGAGTIFVAGQALGLLDENGDPELSGGAFVRAYASNGDLQGSFQLKKVGNQSEITAIAVAGGHLIIAGQMGSLDHSNTDLFVRKIDHAGTIVWGDLLNSAEGQSANSFDSACGVAVDGDGSTLLLGQMNGALAGFSTRRGSVARKYDPSGAILWTKVFEDSGCAVNSGSLRMDAEGQSYLATGSQIRKLSATGEVLWQKDLPIPLGLSAVALTPDALLVAGFTRDVPASEGDSWDIFIRKYNVNGLEGWTRQVGSPGTDNPYAMDVDRAGRIYIGGRSITAYGTLSGVTGSGTGAFLMQMRP